MTMPSVRIPLMAILRTSGSTTLDQAVLEAYGWNDLALPLDSRASSANSTLSMSSKTRS